MYEGRACIKYVYEVICVCKYIYIYIYIYACVKVVLLARMHEGSRSMYICKGRISSMYVCMYVCGVIARLARVEFLVCTYVYMYVCM
jgi:hypothetical protein